MKYYLDISAMGPIGESINLVELHPNQAQDLINAGARVIRYESDGPEYPEFTVLDIAGK